MDNIFIRIGKSLSGKLIITISLLILLGGGIFWFTSIISYRKNFMDETVAFVSSSSEVMKMSVRYDMLTFHREAIQRTVESIASSKPIKRVRIFDGKGKVFYSSDLGEIGKNVDSASPACIGCHSDIRNPRNTPVEAQRWTIYRGRDGHRVLSYIEPIYNEPECFNASCHAHAEDMKVLGILETDYSLRLFDEMVRKQVMDMSLYMIAFLSATAAILYLILWKLVLRPVNALSVGMTRVSSGDLLQKVDVQSDDEIGGLAENFNAMTDELSAARKKMQKWTQSLEDEVKKKTVEIKKTQDKLHEAEKLAALGRFTADIAHEIRNPLTALGGFGRRLQKIVDTEKGKEYADIVVSEASRLEHLLRDILMFSRDAKLCLERQPLTSVIKESLATFKDIFNEHSIKVEVDYGTDLPALIDKYQVRQAALNLISNAIDAMPDGGTLKIGNTLVEANGISYVSIIVSDTGPGIPEDKLPLIFEPFFTTKEIGHGTGLGLSVSRKIVEEHGGFISAMNKPEGGATMGIHFPYQSDEDIRKVPCWEFKKCGRDADSDIKCPAFPNFGRVCWAVAGTFCEGKIQGTFAQKYEDCRKCDFYMKVKNKEL